MNIAQQIIQVLHLRKKVDFSGLGTLSLVTKHAEVDTENDKILPPKQELSFDINRGVKADNQFTALSHEMVKDLLEKGEAKIEGLGKWTNVAGKMHFYPEANVLDNSFYGLEAIDVPRIGVSDLVTDSSTDQPSYQMNRSILWTFLVALPMIGIIYVGVTNSEKLFGVKSFNNLPTQEEKKITLPKVDSSKIKPQDSAKVDSLKNQIMTTTK